MTRLIDQVRSGARKVVVSLYQGNMEKEYESLGWDEAKARLATRTVNGHRYGVPEWQWSDQGPVPSVSLEEIEELEAALRA